MDSAETAKVTPDICFGFAISEPKARIAVSDNGGGLSSAVIHNILDFTVRISAKIAYKEPTRGLQGNAFKTIIGITEVLGGGKVIIESQGLRHEIIARASPTGKIKVDHNQTAMAEQLGTGVYVDLPRCEIYPEGWDEVPSMVDPHANLKIIEFDDRRFMIDPSSKNSTSYLRRGDCKK